MSSIDPTIRLSQTRSLIDSVQQEITQLEGLMSDFLELEGADSLVFALAECLMSDFLELEGAEATKKIKTGDTSTTKNTAKSVRELR